MLNDVLTEEEQQVVKYLKMSPRDALKQDSLRIIERLADKIDFLQKSEELRIELTKRNMEKK